MLNVAGHGYKDLSWYLVDVIVLCSIGEYVKCKSHAVGHVGLIRVISLIPHGIL